MGVNHEGGCLAVVVGAIREDALEGLKDFAGFVGATGGHAYIKDVASGPEHTERGVLPSVHFISGLDGFVCLFYASLLTQVENVFYSHRELRKPYSFLLRDYAKKAKYAKTNLSFFHIYFFFSHFSDSI